MFKKNKMVFFTVITFFCLSVFLISHKVVFAETVLSNPLGTDDPRVLIGRIIKGILGLSGAIALLMFVYGGLVYLTAQGERERIERGKNTLIWATVGLVVIFGSYAFLTYLFAGILSA